MKCLDLRYGDSEFLSSTFHFHFNELSGEEFRSIIRSVLTPKIGAMGGVEYMRPLALNGGFLELPSFLNLDVKDATWMLSIFFFSKKDRRSAIRRNPATAIVIWNLLAVLTLWIFFYCQLIMHFPWFFLEQFTSFNDFSSIKTTRNPTRWVHTVDPIFFSESLMIRSPSKIPSKRFFFWKKNPQKRFPSGSELNMSQAIHYCLRTSVPWVVARCFFNNDAKVTWLSKEGNTSNAWIFSICLKLVYQTIVCVCFFFCVGWYCEAPPLNATWHTECHRYSACIFSRAMTNYRESTYFLGVWHSPRSQLATSSAAWNLQDVAFPFVFGRCSQPNILAQFSRVAILPLMETIRLQWSVIHENEIISEKIFHQRSLLGRLTDGH